MLKTERELISNFSISSEKGQYEKYTISPPSFDDIIISIWETIKQIESNQNVNKLNNFFINDNFKHKYRNEQKNYYSEILNKGAKKTKNKSEIHTLGVLKTVNNLLNKDNKKIVKQNIFVEPQLRLNGNFLPTPDIITEEIINKKDSNEFWVNNYSVEIKCGLKRKTQEQISMSVSWKSNWGIGVNIICYEDKTKEKISLNDIKLNVNTIYLKNNDKIKKSLKENMNVRIKNRRSNNVVKINKNVIKLNKNVVENYINKKFSI